MKCHSLFSEKHKKNINLTSPEVVQTVPKVQMRFTNTCIKFWFKTKLLKVEKIKMTI